LSSFIQEERSMCVEQNEWEKFIGREFRHFKGATEGR